MNEHLSRNRKLDRIDLVSYGISIYHKSGRHKH